MFSAIIGFIKTLFSAGGIILKVLKIALIAGFLWFVFSYLNDKISILKGFSSILKAVFDGLKGALSLIGIG